MDPSSRALDEFERLRTHPSEMLGSMTMVSGRRVYPLALTPEQIHIDDIAHGLSRINRWNGQTAGTLPVAEHSVHVAQLVVEAGHPEYELEALLHDAYEAYAGDIVRPLKMLPEFAFFREAEERGERAIAEHFGLVYPWPDIVHWADDERLRVEHDLRFKAHVATPPSAAKAIFMAHFQRASYRRADLVKVDSKIS